MSDEPPIRVGDVVRRRGKQELLRERAMLADPRAGLQVPEQVVVADGPQQHGCGKRQGELDRLRETSPYDKCGKCFDEVGRLFGTTALVLAVPTLVLGLYWSPLYALVARSIAFAP